MVRLCTPSADCPTAVDTQAELPHHARADLTRRRLDIFDGPHMRALLGMLCHAATDPALADSYMGLDSAEDLKRCLREVRLRPQELHDIASAALVPELWHAYAAICQRLTRWLSRSYTQSCAPRSRWIPGFSHASLYSSYFCAPHSLAILAYVHTRTLRRMQLLMISMEESGLATFDPRLSFKRSSRKRMNTHVDLGVLTNNPIS